MADHSLEIQRPKPVLITKNLDVLSKHYRSLEDNEKPTPSGNHHNNDDDWPSATDTSFPPTPIDDDLKKNLDAGINASAASSTASSPVDIESQQSFPPKGPLWKRVLKNKSFQMIFAAVLAIVIGLVVAATVDKVPDAVKSILALPGYMWLRAVKCVGMFVIG